MLLSRFRVRGHSMMPLLSPNQVVFISSLPYLFGSPKVGDVVVCRVQDKIYIKRIVKIQKGRYILRGDNASDSHDSRKFGAIGRSTILGRVILPRRSLAIKPDIQ